MLHFRFQVRICSLVPPPSQRHLLDGTVASGAGQAGDIGGIRSRDVVGTAELGQHVGVGEAEVAGAGVGVGDAVAAQVAGAGGGGTGVVDDVGLAPVAVLVDGGDVGEGVALGEDVGARADLEAVAAGLVPLWELVVSPGGLHVGPLFGMTGCKGVSLHLRSC